MAKRGVLEESCETFYRQRWRFRSERRKCGGSLAVAERSISGGASTTTPATQRAFQDEATALQLSDSTEGGEMEPQHGGHVDVEVRK